MAKSMAARATLAQFKSWLSCVAFGKLLDPSVPQPLLRKMEIVVVSTSQGMCGFQVNESRVL